MGAFLDTTTQYKQKYGNVAEFNRQNGVQNHNPWAMMAVDLATTGIFVAAQTVGQWGSSSKNDGVLSPVGQQIQQEIDGELSPVGQQIQREIDEILTNGNYTDISDVDTQHKAKELELTEVNQNITTLTTNLDTIRRKLAGLDRQILNATHDPAYYDQLEGEVPGAGWEQQLQDQKLIEDLKKQVLTLQEQERTQNTKLLEEQGKVIPLTDDIAQLAKDFSDLERLGKQLRKAEGRYAIQDLTNETTQDLSNAFKKLNKAVQKGNQKQIDKAALEVEEAYKAYTGQLNGEKNKHEVSYKLAEKYITEAKKGTGKEK